MMKSMNVMAVAAGMIFSASSEAASIIAVSTTSGPGVVKVIQKNNLAHTMALFLPYGMASTGLSVAVGDVNNDGQDDVATGPGAGLPSHVKVFSQTGAMMKSFDAYPGFTGGVRVAMGDVNNDGFADIITGAGPGAGPHVKVFSGNDGSLLRSFFAYPASFSGGVSVAAGDVDGDGYADIITGAGAGAPGGHVKVFDGQTLQELDSFFAYGTNFLGGVRVAATDHDGDSLADIITGAGPGAPGGHVKVFDGMTGGLLASFFSFPTNYHGGINVAGGPILVAPSDSTGAPSVVQIYSDGRVQSVTPFAGYLGGLSVAASKGRMPLPMRPRVPGMIALPGLAQ
jgi:hypothetical protein